jgi:hypothetical protein
LSRRWIIFGGGDREAECAALIAVLEFGDDESRAAFFGSAFCKPSALSLAQRPSQKV